MNPIHRPGRSSPWIAALYAICMAMLTACQGIGLRSGLPPVVIEGQAQLRATHTLLPTRTFRPPEALPATYTPAPALSRPSLTPAPALPELLAGFPLFDGAAIDPAATVASSNSAGIAIPTNKTPGELAAFYEKSLKSAGWMLRYAEGSPLGGFVQEWRKDKFFLTVEYHFPDGQPMVNADVRAIDANQALALLLGFPLPNGTEVVNKVGSTIELDVPQDLKSTAEFFKTQIDAFNWRLEIIKSTGWCGSRGCQEAALQATQTAGQGTTQAVNQPLAGLEPLPTADARKAEYYRVSLPDRTQAEITLLPHRDHTRVYIHVNFADIRRSGMPVPAYPKAAITGVMPGVAMFEVKAEIKDVIKFYEDGLAWLNWQAMPFTVNTEAMYTRSWQKDPHRVISLSLSASKGIVYGQLTCVTCTDPYFLIPTATPTAAPSK
jgi:hypothetical protein